MREIKFRFWDTEDNAMYTPEINNYAFGHYDDLYLSDFRGIFNSDERIIMQYTGLKDKNGKEIYEGDILKTVGCTCGKKFCESFTNEITVVFWYSQTGFSPFANEIESDNHRANWNKEIVGNIYENPELLTNE